MSCSSGWTLLPSRMRLASAHTFYSCAYCSVNSHLLLQALNKFYGNALPAAFGMLGCTAQCNDHNTYRPHRLLHHHMLPARLETLMAGPALQMAYMWPLTRLQNQME